MDEPRAGRSAQARPERPDGGDPPSPSRRWPALLVMLVAVFMELVDASIVNVAIPRIKADLGVSDLGMQWAIGGYVLAFAVVIVTGGRLGDLCGRRRVFLAGVAGFTMASTLCGVAWSPRVLVTARLLQGIAAAVMVPQVLATLQDLFPERERGKAFVVFSAVSGIAPVSGPLVSAVLLDADILGLGWRPIFLVNVPVGAAVVILARRWVPASATRSTRLDIVGVLIATAALVLLLYPLTQGREIGWPAWTYVMMASALPALWLFLRWERRVRDRGGLPLVALGLLRTPTFVVGLVVSVVLYAAFSGPFFVISVFFQVGRGFTPLQTAATVLPWTVGVPVGAVVASTLLVPRMGKWTLTTGAAMMTAGFAAFALVGPLLRNLSPAATWWEFVGAAEGGDLGDVLVEG